MFQIDTISGVQSTSSTLTRSLITCILSTQCMIHFLSVQDLGDEVDPRSERGDEAQISVRVLGLHNCT